MDKYTITNHKPVSDLSFNADYASIIPETEDRWLEAADRDQLNVAIENVRRLVPENGTNLTQIFRAVGNMSPPPDNIFLITDGLPTLGDRNNSNSLVTPSERLELYEEAIEELSPGTPINVILMPLEEIQVQLQPIGSWHNIQKGHF